MLQLTSKSLNRESLSISERKAQKKAKQKEKKAKEDDIDKVLAELSIQYVFDPLCMSRD